MPPPPFQPVRPVRVLLLVASAIALGGWAGSLLADGMGFGAGRRGASRADGSTPESRPAGDGRLGAASAAPRGPGRAVTPPRESPPSVPADEGRSPAAGGGAPSIPAGAGAAPEDGDRLAAQRLSTDLRLLVRDLEFNAGLPEPPQQLVRPSPPPWRPDPGAAGRAAPVIEGVEPRAGPAAGDFRVTIRGRNLAATQVMFGLATAHILSVAPDAVLVLAPRGAAGPVTISVTNADGSYAVAAAPFTYGN